jgi:hypothetical protein
MSKPYYILNHDEESKELSYCVQSLLKHAPDADITIVGVAPTWWDGKFIKTEKHHTKAYDITRKILAAANDAEGELVLVANDYFFNSKESVTAQYFSGDMTAPPKSIGESFRGLIARDADWLRERGYSTWLIGNHAPLHATSEAILNAAKVFDLGRVAFKSVVANMAGVDVKELTEIPEPKLRENKTLAELKKLKFFSLNPEIDVYKHLDAILKGKKK